MKGSSNSCTRKETPHVEIQNPEGNAGSRLNPGMRFRMIDEQDRIRRHIKIFVNQEQARDLGAALTANDEVVIVGALSGG